MTAQAATPEPLDLILDIQQASSAADLPAPELLEDWARAVLYGRRGQAELSLRIVDEPESRQLNHQYRAKDCPTNVLSFPADLPPELALPLLGDLVICAPIVAHEAGQQGKSSTAHWAHMMVHGTLHLLGYDHIEDEDAAIMEQLETDILQQLGFSDPYESIV